MLDFIFCATDHIDYYLVFKSVRRESLVTAQPRFRMQGPRIKNITQKQRI